MNPILIGGIVDAIGKVADDLFTSDKERFEAELELRKIGIEEQRIEAGLITGQQDINRAEAQHRSIFVAGWRPAVGWVCVAGLAYDFLLRPLLGWVAANVVGWSAPPPLDMTTLLTLLGGLLGLGTLRSVEKIRGVAK